MDVCKGIIINHRKSEKGFWYTLTSETEKHCFYCKKDIFSLFEKCEVVFEKRNNSIFLTDYMQLDEISPLKARPDNIIAAFWLSRLADSLTFSDHVEFEFIKKCREAVFSDFFYESLSELENSYIEISGFNLNQEKEKVINDCFYSHIKLRRSLINQLSSRRKK